jgi:peptide chain release factor 2
MEATMGAPDFWNDAGAARKMMQELAEFQQQVGVWEKTSRRLHEALELAELDDESLLEELEREAEGLSADITALEFQTLFSGPYDSKPVFLSIHAGAGGTEAQDWAAMLRRMFLRWCEQHNFSVDALDETPGDVTGLKSAMFRIAGDHPYGWLRSERGVHRLVRISPYDSSARRHTSFAKVEVWPDVAEEIEIEVDEEDLRIDRFRASGAGGQHVQKNETAIRITHMPSGIVVSCQNQRSLTQNMETAMNILKVQLHQLELDKQEAELSRLKGDNVDAGWGNQIRSYVLHPYKMVKDHRTKHETGDPQRVLDGRLDEFMEAYLRLSVGGGTAANDIEER